MINPPGEKGCYFLAAIAPYAAEQNSATGAAA